MKPEGGARGRFEHLGEGAELTESQVRELQDLLVSLYHDVFAQDEFPLPAMKTEPIQITLLPGAERSPQQIRGFRLGKTDQLLLKRRVDEWLRMGVVRLGSEGRGPLRISPAFLVPKKEKVLGRMVIDDRKINKLIDRTQWKGNLDDFSHLEAQYERRFFFVCDAKAGFLQVELGDSARQPLAFPMGEADRATYKPTRLPFRPKVGPAEFQRMVETEWSKNGGEGRWYMVAFSWGSSGATWEQAYALGKEKLLRNLEICRKNGIALEARNAQLFRSELVF